MTTGLALAGVGGSILVAFQAELVAFEPEASAGDIWWLKGQVVGNGPHIAVSAQFLNRGYQGGVIEWVALAIKHASWAKPYPFEAAMDLDPIAVVREKGIANAQSQRGPFTRITLPAKAAAAHCILFAPSHLADQADPTFTPGDYHFDLYAKVKGADAPRLLADFDYRFTAENFASYNAGTPQFFPNTGYRPDLIVPGANAALPAG